MTLTKVKGMTFDHDFGYSSPLFFSLLKKEGEEIMIKSMPFFSILGLMYACLQYCGVTADYGIWVIQDIKDKRIIS